MEVTVTDLTADGCAIRLPKAQLRVKQKVSIKLESLEFVTGVVSHFDANAATIQFDRPLYGPVIEHLRRQYFPK
ncbi:MAG: hypothetical protein AB7F98_14120 [Novosphingobium sp.]